MRTSLTVARVAGIDIDVHLSWLLIAIVLSWTLAEGVFPDTYDDWSTTEYWVVGTIAALLLFVTVLVHEFAHAIVAMRRGLAVPKITLFVFGGVSHMARQPSTAREELAIALAGPLTSFAVAACCGVIAAVTGTWEPVQAIFGYLATVNVALGVFNLLPAFPLDGGRVLRSVVWGRTGSLTAATRLASSVGEFLAYGMLAVGAFLLLAGLALNGLWLMLIAWFLLSAARAEAASTQVDSLLSRLTARDIMDAELPFVSSEATVRELVEEVMLGQGHRAALVGSDEQLGGLVSVTDIRHLPREKWDATSVTAVMTPGPRVVTVGTEERALAILALLGEKKLNQVPVLDDGRIVGLVSRRELIERLQIAEAVGDAASPAPGR